MNILLFAPAILLFYLTSLGWMKTAVQLSICALVQLIIGLPFLLTYPVQYIKGSFDLGRVFEHKWTVNYRFLDRELFENKSFHLGLLIVHILLHALFFKPCYEYFKNYTRLRSLQSHFQPQIDAENSQRDKKKKPKQKKPKTDDEEMTSEQKELLAQLERGLKNQMGGKAPTPAPVVEPEEKDEEKVSIHFDQCTQLVLLPVFLANFIGMVCARSLHYQFYVWYFHSLPYLSWFTDYHASFKILVLLLIEFCWNKYPSTIFSSSLLHMCHIILLFGIARKLFKNSAQAKTVLDKKKE